MRPLPRHGLPGLALAAALAVSASVQAAGPAGALQGEYRFQGRTLVDPPTGEPPDSHLGLMLEGAAARELYARMKVSPVRDLCLDDGSLSKTQGPLRCTALSAGQGWRCAFALQIDRPRLAPASVC